MKKFQPLFYLLLGAVLLWLSYPPYNLFFLLPLGLAPFLYLIFPKPKLQSSFGRATIQEVDRLGWPFSLKTKFFYATLAGFLYFFLAFSWLWSIYPLSWAGVKNPFIGFLITTLIWVLSALIKAIFFGIWAAGSSFLIQKYNNSKRAIHVISKALIVTAVFVIAEYLGSFFFGFLWAGSGTLWGFHWTIGNIGYDLGLNWLSHIFLPIGGVYLLDFILIFFTGLIIFYFFSNGRLKFRLISIAIFFILLFLPNLFLNPKDYSSSARIPIAIIQTKSSYNINQAPQVKIDEFKNQLNLIHQVSKVSPAPKVVVFPEGSNFLNSLSAALDSKALANFFDKLFSEPSLIIDDSVVIENGFRKSRVLYIDSKNGLIDFYDKRFLMPGGEFMPYLPEFLFKLFDKNNLGKFLSERGFEKGAKPPVAVSLSDNSFKTGALVCSGLFSSELFSNLAEKDLDFAVFLTSNGIFRGHEGLLAQNQRISQFRALEAKKSILVAANFGYSYVINPNGRIAQKASNLEPQLFTAEVVLNRGVTFYNKVGDWPVFLALGYLAFAFKNKSYAFK